MKKRLSLGVLAVVILGWLGLYYGPGLLVSAPDISFGPTWDEALADPDNALRKYPYDLARLEQGYPLSRADLLQLTPENLKALSQDQLDQIYGRLTAGPIPDGPYLGSLIFSRDGSGRDVPRLQNVLGGVIGKVSAEKIKAIERAGELLWKGKIFYRNERVLRNFIEDLTLFTPLIDDVTALPKDTVPREGMLAWIWPTTEVYLMFPAKLYCGQSLMDGRRESVIIDYAYGDKLPLYQQHPDSLAGRNGLRIRDEIRMIRPGFYIGRAYSNRIFLVNFFLYNAEIAEAELSAFTAGDALSEDCWTGEQSRVSQLP